MTEWLPFLTGSGGAIVVLAIGFWLFYTGKLHSESEFSRLLDENDELRTANDKLRYALDTERKTLNETASAGQVTNQLIAALTAVATGKVPPLASAPPTGRSAGGAGP